MSFNNKKNVVIMEIEGWSDKWEDWHRRDTFPILNAIKNKWFEWEVMFYEHKKQEDLFNYIKDNVWVVIWRINPGNLKEIDEYFQFLNRLSQEWVFVNTHPDVMINLDFKDILVKLNNSSYSDKGSVFYREYDKFKVDFKNTLLEKKFRVLKQNYWSTGEWVWLVKLEDDASVTATEAVNNEKFKFNNVGDFILDFKKYFEDDPENAVYFKWKPGFVDVRYLDYPSFS